MTGYGGLERKLMGGKKYICVSKSSSFMQISGSNFSYIHTSVILVRPQSSSMQKKGVWAAREEPQAVIYIENGPMWLAESDEKTNGMELRLGGWTSAKTFSHIWTVVSEQNVSSHVSPKYENLVEQQQTPVIICRVRFTKYMTLFGNPNPNCRGRVRVVRGWGNHRTPELSQPYG